MFDRKRIKTISFYIIFDDWEIKKTIMRFTFILLALITSHSIIAQNLIWSEDFQGTLNWDLTLQSGFNDPDDANSWVISDDEGGVTPPNCSIAANGNNTLHITCQGGLCSSTGAIYNPGDGNLGGFNSTTDKRAAYTQAISTINETELEFRFDWIGIGQEDNDFAELEYSIDSGISWNLLWTQTQGDTCNDGKGRWSEQRVILPTNLENQNDLRFAFRWQNNNDGEGTSPSFAVNNLRLFSDSFNDVANSNFTYEGNLCEGSCIDFIDLSTGEPDTWQWNFDGAVPTTSSAQNPSNVCFDSSGIYNVSLTVQNENGQSTFTFPLNFTATPTIEAFGDTLIDVGGAAQLEAQPGGFGTVAWTPTEFLDCDDCLEVTATPVISTLYTVVITDVNGCQGSDQVNVTVNFRELIGVPSAFSPNNDGLNDILYVKGIGITQMDFKVFNRYGQQIFSSSSQGEGWDGTYNGQRLNQGVFAYTLDYSLVNGQSGELSGNVTLVK